MNAFPCQKPEEKPASHPCAVGELEGHSLVTQQERLFKHPVSSKGAIVYPMKVSLKPAQWRRLRQKLIQQWHNPLAKITLHCLAATICIALITQIPERRDYWDEAMVLSLYCGILWNCYWIARMIL